MSNKKVDPRADTALNMVSDIYMNSTTKFTNLGGISQRLAVDNRLNQRAQQAIKSKSPQNKKLQTVKISQLGNTGLWKGLDNLPERKSKSPGNQQRLIHPINKQSLSPQPRRYQIIVNINKIQIHEDIKQNQNLKNNKFQRNHNRNGENQVNTSRYRGQTSATGNIVSQNLMRNMKSTRDDFGIGEKSGEKNKQITTRNQLNTKVQNKSITQSRAIQDNKDKKVVSFSPQKPKVTIIEKKQPQVAKPSSIEVKKYQIPAKNNIVNRTTKKQQPYVYVPPQKKIQKSEQNHSQIPQNIKSQTSIMIEQRNLQYRSLSPKKEQPKKTQIKPAQNRSLSPKKQEKIQQTKVTIQQKPLPYKTLTTKIQQKKPQVKNVIQNKPLPYRSLSPQKQQNKNQIKIQPKKVDIKPQPKKQIPKIQIKPTVIKQTKTIQPIKSKSKADLINTIQTNQKQQQNNQKGTYVYQPPQKRQFKEQSKEETLKPVVSPKKAEIKVQQTNNRSSKNISVNNQNKSVVNFTSEQKKYISTPAKQPVQIVQSKPVVQPKAQQIQRKPTIKPAPRQVASYSSIQFQQVSQIKKKQTKNNQNAANVSLHISSKQSSPNKKVSESNISIRRNVNFSSDELKKDWSKIKNTLKYQKSYSQQSSRVRKNVPQRQDVAMKMLAQIFLNASTRYFPGLSMLLKRGISKQQIQAIRSKSSQFKINVLSVQKQKKSPIKPKTQRKLNWVQSQDNKNKQKQNNRVYQGDVTATQYKLKKQEQTNRQEQKSKTSTTKGPNIVKQNLQKNNRKITRDDFLINRNQKQPSEQSKSIRQSPDVYKRQVSQKDVEDSKKEVLKMKEQISKPKINTSTGSYSPAKDKQETYVYQPPALPKKNVQIIKPVVQQKKPTVISKNPSPPKQTPAVFQKVQPVKKPQPVKPVVNTPIVVIQKKTMINSGQNNNNNVSIVTNKSKVSQKAEQKKDITKKPIITTPPQQKKPIQQQNPITPATNTLISSKSQPSLWNQTQVKKQIQKNITNNKPAAYVNKTNIVNPSNKNISNSSSYVYQPPNPKKDVGSSEQIGFKAQILDKKEALSKNNISLKNVQSEKNISIKPVVAEVIPKTNPIVKKQPVLVQQQPAKITPTPVVINKNPAVNTSKVSQKPVQQQQPAVKKQLPNQSLNNTTINNKSTTSLNQKSKQTSKIVYKQPSSLSKRFCTIVFLILKKRLTANISQSFNRIYQNSLIKKQNLKIASCLGHVMVNFVNRYELLKKRQSFNIIKKSIINSVNKIKSQKPQQENNYFSSGRKQSATRIIFWLLKDKLSSYFQPLRSNYLKITNKTKNKSQVLQALVRVIQKRAYIHIKDGFKKIKQYKNHKKQTLEKFAAALNKLKYTSMNDHFSTIVNKDIKQLGTKAKTIKQNPSSSKFIKNSSQAQGGKNTLSSSKSQQTLPSYKYITQQQITIKFTPADQAKLQNKRKQMQKKLADLQKKKQNIRNQVNQMNTDKRSFTKKNNELKQKLKQLQKEISNTQAILPSHSQQKNKQSNANAHHVKDSSLTEWQIVPILTRIYAYLFQDDRNEIVIQRFLSDNQHSFQLPTNPSLLNQWKVLMKNAELKRLVKKYQGQQPRQKKINEIVNEQNVLMSRLLRSFIRERYIWEWVNIIANQ